MKSSLKFSAGVVLALSLTAFSLGGCNFANAPKTSNAPKPADTTEKAKEEPTEFEKVEFTLENDTNRVMTEFYVSTPSAKEWGENLLDKDNALNPGESAKVTINDGRKDCKYDLLTTFAGTDDGTVGEGSLEETNVDICDGTTYKFVSK